jgi:predicted metal-dependent phosphoesterase TrpH
MFSCGFYMALICRAYSRLSSASFAAKLEKKMDSNVWDSVNSNAVYSKADTHMHTTCSDGLMTPAEMVDYIVAKTDLRVIAVTDHDTADGAFVAREYALQRGYPLEIIIGQEVSTAQGDIVGLFLYSPLPAYATAAEAIAAIHAQGGLAIAVHPFSGWNTLGNMTGVGRLIDELPLDGVEVRNGFPSNVMTNPLATWFNRRGPQLAELGGSDSHTPFTVGQAYTRFPGTCAADFRRAVVARTTRAAGPLWTPRNLVRVAATLWRRGLPKRELEPEALEILAHK